MTLFKDLGSGLKYLKKTHPTRTMIPCMQCTCKAVQHVAYQNRRNFKSSCLKCSCNHFHSTKKLKAHDVQIQTCKRLGIKSDDNYLTQYFFRICQLLLQQKSRTKMVKWWVCLVVVIDRNS